MKPNHCGENRFRAEIATRTDGKIHSGGRNQFLWTSSGGWGGGQLQSSGFNPSSADEVQTMGVGGGGGGEWKPLYMYIARQSES
jgi:hypothetical protein